MPFAIGSTNHAEWTRTQKASRPPFCWASLSPFWSVKTWPSLTGFLRTDDWSVRHETISIGNRIDYGRIDGIHCKWKNSKVNTLIFLECIDGVSNPLFPNWPNADLWPDRHDTVYDRSSGRWLSAILTPKAPQRKEGRDDVEADIEDTIIAEPIWSF